MSAESVEIAGNYSDTIWINVFPQIYSSKIDAGIREGGIIDVCTRAYKVESIP